MALMGLLTWLRRGRGPDLTQTLMQAEIARQQRASEVELRRLDIEKFRLEKEFENIEAIAEQKRQDREQAQVLRERKREWMAQARERKKQKALAPADNGAPGGGENFRQDCRVCTGKDLSQQTAAEIIWHSNGHRVGAVQ